ncbi:DNA polymerase alpha/epsilon subunit B family protein [Babesia bovis T2Bo]|uniref:DNA polymerase alpha/epsilon subunit B family protein n=1 Tax=Babesia bovis T2Bo TaxID=484906 RepID=UPI001C35FAB4|nr:DNA polymerase alpha/epsilon subunit B family protein [Babesia bovis T2Bo]EDO06425.2 DNA polymerase alpha/epsilon subunit B family protein [Babesia bovis T2Bo]
MASLFDDDISDMLAADPGPAKETRDDSHDSVYQLSSSLRRFGITKLPPAESGKALLEALTKDTLWPVTLESGLKVDIYLWNYVVNELSKGVDVTNVLTGVYNWSYYQEKLKIESNLDRTQEVFIYNVLKDVPMIHYSRNKKKFTCDFTPNDSSSVVEIRYELALEKIKRSNIHVTTVDAISRSCTTEQNIVGILGLDKKGDMSLKGALTQLRLIITDETIICSGIYCPCNTVIVRGVIEPYTDSIRCIEIKQPPPFIDIDVPDCFGGTLTRDNVLYLERRFQHKFEHGASERWVVLSELFLDNEDVLNSFEVLLDTFLDLYQTDGFPIGIIIMGNFNSQGFNLTGNTNHYADGFDKLYVLLMKSKFRALLISVNFILVPGTKDATPSSTMLPMPPLLAGYTSNIANRIKASIGSNSKFMVATNPCRIRHLSKRMIFCRNDVLRKLLGSALLTTGTAMNTTPPHELVNMLTHSIYGQGHICPNKPGTNTILKHDATLLLYPQPDLICISDLSSPPFADAKGSTVFCNVDPFHKAKSFLSYDAISGKCQKFSL